MPEQATPAVKGRLATQTVGEMEKDTEKDGWLLGSLCLQENYLYYSPDLTSRLGKALSFLFPNTPPYIVKSSLLNLTEQAQ